jgi:hypothetical protein
MRIREHGGRELENWITGIIVLMVTPDFRQWQSN